MQCLSQSKEIQKIPKSNLVSDIWHYNVTNGIWHPDLVLVSLRCSHVDLWEVLAVVHRVSVSHVNDSHIISLSHSQGCMWCTMRVRFPEESVGWCCRSTVSPCLSSADLISSSSYDFSTCLFYYNVELLINNIWWQWYEPFVSEYVFVFMFFCVCVFVLHYLWCLSTPLLVFLLQMSSLYLDWSHLPTELRSAYILNYVSLRGCQMQYSCAFFSWTWYVLSHRLCNFPSRKLNNCVTFDNQKIVVGGKMYHAAECIAYSGLRKPWNPEAAL